MSDYTHKVFRKLKRQDLRASAIILVGMVPTFLHAAVGDLSFSMISYLRESIDSIESLVLAILQILITIAVPIIVFFIIYAGFMYVTAQGNAEKTQKATRAFTYAVIGAIMVIGAVAAAELVRNLVDAFRE